MYTANYVHINTHNQISCKYLRIFIMHFYIPVGFHIQRYFHSSLFVRVYDSGHPVIYAWKYFTNNPGRKLYPCMTAGSTRHQRIIQNPIIVHTKILFAPAYHPRNKILSKTKLSHSSLLQPRAIHTSFYTSKYNFRRSDHFPLGRQKQVSSNKTSRFKHKFESKITPFTSLGLWLGFRLGIGSNKPLEQIRYISLQTTRQVNYYYYLYVICKYYHTKEDGRVLGHPCSLQVPPH